MMLARRRRIVTIAPPALLSSSSSSSAVTPALATTARAIASNRNAVEDSVARPLDYHLRAPKGPGTIDMTAPSLDLLDTTDMFVDKRCFGIPFKIDDERVQEIACQHHGTAVDVRGVERFFVPFWMAHTSAGGTFSAQVLRQHPLFLRPTHVWDEPGDFTFSYPFEEHHIFNQVPGTYAVPPAVAYKTLAGQHVPSMLISRYELLEEAEDMKNSPRLLPFHLSVKTAINILNTRVNRDLLDREAKKQLRKFYINGYYQANVKFIGVLFEIVKIRPVFLPMYKLDVATISHSKYEVPTYVCGATGKASGPIIHAPLKRKVYLGGAASFAGLMAGAIMSGPVGAGFMAGLTTWAAIQLRHLRAVNAAKLDVEGADGTRDRDKLQNAHADETGYKWKVEDEEKYEYEHRETLREKARRRMRFEQRVQEEMAQDEARFYAREKTEKARAARPRRSRRPGQVDADPLGYYEVLGLRGVEAKTTRIEIAKAFRKEAQKHHPDMHEEEEKEAAKARMQKIVEAYNVLRDKKLRHEYDSGFLTSGAGASNKN